MIDPSVPLQKAIYDALRNDAGAPVLIGTPARVYDRVPDNAVHPYVTLGPCQVIPADDQCHAGAECFPQVDIWSRAVGQVEAKRIAAWVARVLDAELAIEGHEVVIHEIEAVRHLEDPDGLTSHSLVTPRYVTAPTA